MIDLSLNEAQSLAARAARGAGFSWGLADDIGVGARELAREGVDWGGALVRLLIEAPGFSPPRAGGTPLCPARTAAWINDAPPEGDALTLADVGRPLWLAALLKPHGIWGVETDLAAARADVALTRGASPAAARVRRATVARADLDALSAYAARTYVPESARSRARGAGGGSVDDE